MVPLFGLSFVDGDMRTNGDVVGHRHAGYTIAMFSPECGMLVALLVYHFAATPV